jgi:hypothetical protein
MENFSTGSSGRGTHQSYRGVADTIKPAYNGTAGNQKFVSP